MTDEQRRRIALLQQTKGEGPAIHPRYQNTYHSLYQDDVHREKGSFFLRLLCAIVIFSAIFYMEYTGQSVGEYDTGQVIQCIQEEIMIKN